MKRMVWRPACRLRSACSIAERISFTPEKTADSAMNSCPKAFAVSRASVVLPTPGGPQRIIECGCPDSNASRSGLSGPSRCFCPITSSSVAGLSSSASGTPLLFPAAAPRTWVAV